MATALPRPELLTRFTARHPRHRLVVRTPRTLKTNRARDKAAGTKRPLALGEAGASGISMLIRGSGRNWWAQKDPYWESCLSYSRTWGPACGRAVFRDRKSTRLNSSHLGISYAVFCLKKKK